MVTATFSQRYDRLSDHDAESIDAAIIRLMEEHETAWARSHRVVGEDGSSWIIPLRTAGRLLHLYWDYLEDGGIVLLGFVDAE